MGGISRALRNQSPDPRPRIIATGENAPIEKQIKDTAFLQNLKAKEKIYAQEGAGRAVTNDDARRFAQQSRNEVLDGDWRDILSTAPAGTKGWAPTIGQVLQGRYYGDEFGNVVAAADQAFTEGRPSFYGNRQEKPSEWVGDRLLLTRGAEGKAQASPTGIIHSSEDAIRNMTSDTRKMNAAHRGVENHEIAHYPDIREPGNASANTSQEGALGEVGSPEYEERMDRIISRVGENQALERIGYAARPDEIIANIGAHKRNYFSRHGSVPTTREEVTAMFDAMGDEALAFDVSDPGFDAKAWDIDLDDTRASHWDHYGPDPDATHGPSSGLPLRGARETEMNLGNIWAEAPDDVKAKMVETYLQTVQNEDIRNSLLARTS